MSTSATRRADRESLQSGFSLIEIFVVLGLVAILAAMAGPRLGDMVGRYRLNSASRELLGDIQVARMLAITRNREVRVRFVDVDNNYSDPTSKGGMYQLEICNIDATGSCNWEVVDRQAGTGEGRCPKTEFCTDFVAEYGSVSIAYVGLAPITRALNYGPDGFILNSIDEFALDGNAANIRVVLMDKRAIDLDNPRVEARILRIDRAGNVTLKPYRGSDLPSQ